MILYLEYSAGGIRGGEVYSAYFHSFLHKRFDNIAPEEIPLFPDEIKNPLRHCLYSYKRVKQINPSIIIVNVSSGIRNVLAVWWMKLNRRKVITILLEQRLAFNTKIPFFRWIVRQCEKYLIKKADIILVISGYTEGLARQQNARSETPCIIAPPGMENYIQRAEDFKPKLPVSGEPLKLLFVGMCVWHKGIKYLVEAMNLLKEYNITLDIIGKYDGNDHYFKSIKQFVDKNDLDEKIRFHGFVETEEVIRLFGESSIYVHPSLMEGYGMVLAEAMSFGLPIVATTAGAIPELVEDGINGILVEPRDSAGLANAILKLCDNEQLRLEISELNIEKVKTLTTWRDFDSILEKEMVPAIEKVAGIKAKDSN
ncbi:MAG: glycosyltransferase family 4 protein [candidate division Zixibacteria bacterium]